MSQCLSFRDSCPGRTATVDALLLRGGGTPQKPFALCWFVLYPAQRKRQLPRAALQGGPACEQLGCWASTACSRAAGVLLVLPRALAVPDGADVGTHKTARSDTGQPDPTRLDAD